MARAEFQVCSIIELFVVVSESLDSQASAIDRWQIGINGSDFRISSQKP